MKILVTCKRVPNPEQKLKLGGGKLDLSAANWQLNTFDEYAVETALRLTEKGKGGERSGEVVAVTIGPKEVAQQLRGVLAMGADAACWSPPTTRRSTPTSSRTCWQGGRAREAGPGRPGQAGGRRRLEPGRAAPGGLLGWPQATFLASIRAGRRRQERHRQARGRRRRRGEAVRLPAVVTVDLRIIAKKAVRNEALARPPTPSGRRPSATRR